MSEELSHQVAERVPLPENSKGETDAFLTALAEYVWCGPDGQVYSANQVEILLERIRQAISPKLALACSGIDKRTLSYWLRQGKSRQSKFRDFAVAYRRYRGEAEATLLRALYSQGQHTCAATLAALKIMRPGKYEKQEGGEDKEPVRVVVIPPEMEP